MGLNSRQRAYTESKKDQREGFVLFFLRLLRKYVGKKVKRCLRSQSPPVLRFLSPYSFWSIL